MLLDAFWVPEEELVALVDPPLGAGGLSARMTYQEEFMACPRKGHRRNGMEACVAN